MSGYSSLLQTLQESCLKLQKENEELKKVNMAHKLLNGTLRRDNDNLCKVIRKTLLKLENYNNQYNKQIIEDLRKAININTSIRYTKDNSHFIDICPCNECNKNNLYDCDHPCNSYCEWAKQIKENGK